MKPRPFILGEPIRIAAPAGPFDRGKFKEGVALLKKYARPSFRKDISARTGYLAGPDERRGAELIEALSSPDPVLLFARGGYGCQRLLPLLIKDVSPKIVVGSSDLTVVLIHLWKYHRLPTLYGPMVSPHLHRPGAVKRLMQAITDPDWFAKHPISATAVLRKGRASGTLVGGCLTMVLATLGTPWELDTKDTILFLEDTNEEPYRVDRMLTQLIQAGKLEDVRGIVFGTFKHHGKFFPAAIRRVCEERLKDFRGPILWGARFGHHPDPLMIPFGGEGRIEDKQLIFTQGIF